MAKISIESHSVQFGLFGDVGDHLYLVYTDDNGDEFVINGEPENQNVSSGFGKIIITSGDAFTSSHPDYRNPASASFFGSREIASGSDATRLWGIMTQHATNIGSANIDYNILPSYQNSNSVIASVLNAVGMDISSNQPYEVEDGQPRTGEYPGDSNFLTLSTSLTGSSVADTLVGGDANDTLAGSGGADSIIGGDGNDSLSGGDGADYIYGDNVAGNDTTSTHNDIISGGAGNDTIIGDIGNDNINGGADNDIIAGGAGNDTIIGGGGNDDITGGDGNDTITVTAGTSLVHGNDGDDAISSSGLGTSNTLYGDDGNEQSTYDFQHIFISKWAGESCLVSLQTKEQGYFFPLYFENNITQSDFINTTRAKRKPNLDDKIVAAIAKKLKLPFVPDHEDKASDDHSRFTPLDLLDYIYAVLHSPSYRSTYKEFLKIDFPRIPYTADTETFWKLVALGGELRALHLLEHPALAKPITTFPEAGDCMVEKPAYQKGKVYINKIQYFDNVPEVAWNFYIGGYQPAQKWLKDRKGRTLTSDDIRHWQKIIVALSNTDRLMKEIDVTWKP